MPDPKTLISPKLQLVVPWRQAAVMTPILFGVAATSQASVASLLIYGLLGAVTVGALAWRYWRKLRLAQFGVLDGTLGLHSPYGVTPVAQGIAGVRVTRVARAEDSRQHVQMWVGPAGSVALHERVWDGNELRELSRQLGLETVDHPHPLSVRELARAYPGSLPWYAAHPVPAAALLLATVFVVLVGVDQIG